MSLRLHSATQVFSDSITVHEATTVSPPPSAVGMLHNCPTILRCASLRQSMHYVFTHRFVPAPFSPHRGMVRQKVYIPPTLRDHTPETQSPQPSPHRPSPFHFAESNQAAMCIFRCIRYRFSCNGEYLKSVPVSCSEPSLMCARSLQNIDIPKSNSQEVKIMAIPCRSDCRLKTAQCVQAHFCMPLREAHLVLYTTQHRLEPGQHAGPLSHWCTRRCERHVRGVCGVEPKLASCFL